MAPDDWAPVSHDGAARSPGWYSDGRGGSRWWNGVGWSESVASPQDAVARDAFGVPLDRIAAGGRTGWPVVLVVVTAVVAVVLALGLGAWALFRAASDVFEEVERAERAEVFAGTPGYSTFRGSYGRPLRVGAPWGRSCAPIVLNVHDDVPHSSYVELVSVVAEARAAGLNVTVQSAGNRWRPADLYPPGLTSDDVELVSVLVSPHPGPSKGGAERARHVIRWETELAPDSDHEYFTEAADTLHLPSLGSDPLENRRTFRVLIGFTQGIHDASAPGTALKYRDPAAPDAFSERDLEAMTVMSGCAGK